MASNGYDIYLYGVRSPSGVSKVQFPTWTVYGNQDDLDYSWATSSLSAGTNLGNGTWKYHVNISDHNNEAGHYITDFYIFGKEIATGTAHVLLKTNDYIGSLYYSDEDAHFNNNKDYKIISDQLMLYSNFTYEFDAMPDIDISLIDVGEWADPSATHNFIISDEYSRNGQAGIGLSIGKNGAMAIAHSNSYYYSLLKYEGDLSQNRKYKFVIDNNIPKLYVDDKLISIGIKPISPVTTLVSKGFVIGGIYGGYTGYANNIVLYNSVR